MLKHPWALSVVTVCTCKGRKRNNMPCIAVDGLESDVLNILLLSRSKFWAVGKGYTCTFRLSGEAVYIYM